MSKESAFRKKVTDYIKSLGWRSVCLTGTKNSWPDLLVVPMRRPPFFIELKKKKKDSYGVTAMQEQMGINLRRMGQVSLVLYANDLDWQETILDAAITRETIAKGE